MSGRQMISDETSEDLDTIARIRQELRELAKTSLTTEQITRLARIAVETRGLQRRAETRYLRREIKRGG